REQPATQVALGAAGSGQVLAAAGPDLDLRGDQLAGDRLAQPRVVGGGVAQPLEVPDELERLGIEHGELLLQADGEVGGCLKRGTRSVDVELHGRQMEDARSDRSTARRADRPRGSTGARSPRGEPGAAPRSS